MSRDEILSEIILALVNMDSETVVKLAKRSLEAGIPPEITIENGLSRGMEKVGELFASGEYFVPEVVVCADALYAGLNILKPAALKQIRPKGRIVIGVVEGDTHDIGKNIVAMMLEAAGFDVIDLGRNVPLPAFSQKAVESDADIVALSSLMTTTMEGMKTVIDDLRGLPDKRYRYVIVGGAPVSKAFAAKIGADGYATDAAGAVKIARELIGQDTNTTVQTSENSTDHAG